MNLGCAGSDGTRGAGFMSLNKSSTLASFQGLYVFSKGILAAVV